MVICPDFKPYVRNLFHYRLKRNGMKRFLLTSAILLTAIFITGIFTGCSKQINDKMTGDWHFEKVRLYSGIFSFQNITNDYRDFVLSFSSDGTFSQHNTRTGDFKNGSWRIDRSTVTNGENTTTIQTLILSFNDARHGYPDIHIWNDFQVTNRRMTGTEHQNGDVYYFTLRK